MRYFKFKKITDTFPYFIIAVGIFLRVREYVANRSLWVDEAFLALNIQNRPFLGLLQPLTDNQHAPIGFLWIEKVLVTTFGVSEYVFRVVPLLSGILSLIIFFILFRRFFTRKKLLLALALFALSDVLIRYSVELKQYSTEVLVSLLVYLVFLPFLQGKQLSKKRVVFLGMFGVISLLFSHAAILVLLSLLILFGITSCIKHDLRKTVLSAIACILFGSIFSLLYLHDAKNAYSNSAFLAEWPYVFLLPRMPVEFWANINGFYTIFIEFFGPISSLSAVTAFLIGIITRIKKAPIVSFSFLLPLCLALFSSGLHKYPFVARVFLFTAPTVIYFVTEGVFWTAKKIKKSQSIYFKVIIIVSFSALFFYSILIGLHHLKNPRQIEEIKPVLEYYRERRKAGDTLYIYYASQAPYIFYASRYGLQHDTYIVGLMSRYDWTKYKADLDKLKGKKRVWVMFSHTIVATITPNGQAMSEDSYIITYLDSIGHQLSSYKQPGAAIYLYNLSR